MAHWHILVYDPETREPVARYIVATKAEALRGAETLLKNDPAGIEACDGAPCPIDPACICGHGRSAHYRNGAGCVHCRQRCRHLVYDCRTPEDRRAAGAPSPCGWAFFGHPCNLTGEHGHCAECAAPIPTDRPYCLDHAAAQGEGAE